MKNWKSKCLIGSLFVLFMGGCAGCCDEVFEICVDTVGIKVITLNNEGIEPVENNTDTIPAEAFALGAILETEDSDCIALDPRNLFSQKAFATSCPTEITYNQNIDQINIYSLMDFDDNHPTGAILNDLFEYNNLSAYTIESNYFLRDTIHLLLFSEPSHPQQQFILEINLSDETTYSDTTQVVWLD